MAIGSLMLDVAGLSLQQEEADVLRHPQVGGIILFARNYESPQQLQQLIQSIRAIRKELIIAVDQEGGRVQRFKSGLTRLPPLRVLGDLYQHDQSAAMAQAEDAGWLMAAEMLSLGVDISFAPVLDIDYGRSEVIGDRAFAADGDTIAALAAAYIKGMNAAGMAATGKHFPGHGWVQADSHLEIPVDQRDLSEIANDIAPFQQLSSVLAGIMPAHVIYSQLDAQPAGFSSYWIQQQLRQQLGFNGVVFSDDLSMEGASVAGSFPQRAAAAFAAGCDMVLVCNRPDAAKEVLAWLETAAIEVDQQRMQQLCGRPALQWDALQQHPKWQQLQAQLKDRTMQLQN